MANYTSFLKLTAILAITLACTSPRAPSATPPMSSDLAQATGIVIRTDSTEYHPVIADEAITVNVIASFTNNTADTLTLHPCYQHPPYPLAVGLDRLEGNKWGNALDVICTTALMFDPPRLLPGAMRIDTLHLRGSTRANTGPAFAPGPLYSFYRLHYYSVYRKWYPRNPPPNSNNPLGEPVDASSTVSNVFRLVQ